jgi:enoyl-CoA hydratase/carnithine racemase
MLYLSKVSRMNARPIQSSTTAFASRRTYAVAQHNVEQAATRNHAMRRHGAPASLGAIGDEYCLLSDLDHVPSAYAREIGCMRRFFLLRPSMTADELESLAYRVRALSKNKSISSVLIATNGEDDEETGCLPTFARELGQGYQWKDGINPDAHLPPAPGATWHVSGGYDPVELYTSGKYLKEDYVSQLLRSLSDLSSACKGKWGYSHVPVIMVPHGLVTDGGFAFLMSSFVLATDETCFRIRNLSKGLSFDPVGLSYVLPRLGHQYGQYAQKYIGCGMILGLMGYEADADDMMETGLATNKMNGIGSLGVLEHTLSECPPWERQNIVKDPVRFYGAPPPVLDHNYDYRNVAVSDAIHCVTDYRADARDYWTLDDEDAYIFDDSSVEADLQPWTGERSSTLLDYAYTFNEIFSEETSLQGIHERFKEIASRETNDVLEQEGIDVAANFVKRLSHQSPLAASVAHQLLRIGGRAGQNFESCMQRELRVQKRMLQKEDYANWAKFASVHGEDANFGGWKHKSFAEVTPDEVASILQE